MRDFLGLGNTTLLSLLFVQGVCFCLVKLTLGDAFIAILVSSVYTGGLGG